MTSGPRKEARQPSRHLDYQSLVATESGKVTRPWWSHPVWVVGRKKRFARKSFLIHLSVAMDDIPTESTQEDTDPVGLLRQLQSANRHLTQHLRDHTAELKRAQTALDACQQINTQNQQIELERSQLLAREWELNELKSNFVTLAFHEFRTPMGTILSSAALIGRYNGADDREKRERHVQRIKSAVNSLTGLLNDFLSLSQMEQETLYGSPYPLDVVSFCNEVIDDMQAVIKPGKHVVYHHLQGPSAVKIDGQMLKNVLINLLVNASKYLAEGKEIELTTAVRSERLSITVKDQGIGIPDTDKDNLFISFFRARNTVQVQGTGLGLYIVKRYLDLLEGTITFTSQLDWGTVFTVELPLTSPVQPPSV